MNGTQTKTAQINHWKREGWDWAQHIAQQALTPQNVIRTLDPEWAIRDETLHKARVAGARAYQAGKVRP